MPDGQTIVKFITDAAPELVVMLAIVWALYRLALRAMDLHYQHLTKNVVPLFERGATAMEKMATAGETLVEQIGEDHKILFASQRGLRWEFKELEKKVEAGQESGTATP